MNYGDLFAYFSEGEERLHQRSTPDVAPLPPATTSCMTPTSTTSTSSTTSSISSSQRPSRPTFLPIKHHARPARPHHHHNHHHHHPSCPITAPGTTIITASNFTTSAATSDALFSTAPSIPPLCAGEQDTPTLTPTPGTSPPVIRRRQHSTGEEGERLVRRVSYLKATSADRPYSDEDVDSEPEDRYHTPATTPAGSEAALTPTHTPLTPGSRSLPAPLPPSPSGGGSHSQGAAAHGALHYKLAVVDGKRAVDRSWKSGCGVLRGRKLFLYRDKTHPIQSPVESPELQVCVRGAGVCVASDYSRRRHVVRLTTPAGTQLLLQADSGTAMSAWLQTLQQHAGQEDPYSDREEGRPNSILGDGFSNGSYKGIMLPGDLTATPASTPTPTPTYTSPTTTALPAITATTTTTNTTSTSTGSSPPSAKSSRKLGALRTHSPTGQSPQSKNRKSTGSSIPYTAETGPEKSRTWKGLIGKRLKRIQGSTPASASYPPGASFGVPLSLCPMSDKHGMLVPLVVAVCVEVVEERGLNTQGIYRIPGNKAAVTYLTEMVNRGQHAIDLTDPRWSDVNVISSLLKQYFQKLPEPLIPADLYPLLIQASQTPDPHSRLLHLRVLVHELPEYHYDTLRLLCLHLQRVVQSSANNRMDVHNLAIVFGPTLIRAAHENMEKMVKDMPHQCRIVEALISQASWFFSDEDGDDVAVPLLPEDTLQGGLDSTPITDTDHQALLDNVHKLQHSSNNGTQKADSKKILVSSIISAASRKVNKSRQRRSGEDIESDWNSRDIERSRDGGERLLRDTAGDRSRENDRLPGDADRSRDSDCLSQRSSHSDIAMSLEATPKSSRSMSKASCYSNDSTSGLLHNSLLEDYSDVKFRKDNTRSSLDHGQFGCNNSYRRDSLLSNKDGSLYDDSGRTSMHVDPTDDNNMTLTSSFGYSTPNIMNPSGQRTNYSSSSRPVSTHEGSRLSSVLSTRPAGYGDGAPIKSYRDLSAHTQERIRRFEEETLAMLDRDLSKQRRLSTKLDFDGRTLEEAWQKAKKDLEEEDLLDRLADNPSEMVQRMAREAGYPSATTGDVLGSLSLPSTASITASTGRHYTSDNNNSLSPASAPFSIPFSNVCPQQDDLSRDLGIDMGLGSGTTSREGGQDHQEDGSDILSAITATFEKMRSEAGGSSTPPSVTPIEGSNVGGYEEEGLLGECWPDQQQRQHSPRLSGRGGQCKLYRDPSLHRRAANQDIEKEPLAEAASTQRKGMGLKASLDYNPSASVKRTDSLTKSEKTEHNLKEKSEKRCREMRRSEEDKKQAREARQRGAPTSDGDGVHKTRRLSTDVRHRRHNVKELKEKFEQNAPTDVIDNSNNFLTSNGGNGSVCNTLTGANNLNNSTNNNRRGGSRKSRSNIKRRHTVGGTKDLGKVVAIQKALLQWQQLQSEQKRSILEQQLNPRHASLTADTLGQLLAFEPWEARERLGASSPDLPHLLELLLPGPDHQQQHRPLSVREPWALQPVLESHV